MGIIYGIGVWLCFLGLYVLCLLGLCWAVGVLNAVLMPRKKTGAPDYVGIVPPAPHIKEGSFKKGGISDRPNTPRPDWAPETRWKS